MGIGEGKQGKKGVEGKTEHTKDADFREDHWDLQIIKRVNKEMGQFDQILFL